MWEDFCSTSKSSQQTEEQDKWDRKMAKKRHRDNNEDIEQAQDSRRDRANKEWIVSNEWKKDTVENLHEKYDY